jgi:hypothetical protein
MWNITAVNGTGGDVFDIHVLISGTGGTIADLMGVSPAGQTIGSPNGNDIHASWDPALAAGAKWEANFKTDFAPLTIVDMYWTDSKGGKVADVPMGDRTFRQVVPEPGTVLTMLSGGATLVLLGLHRRRRILKNA